MKEYKVISSSSLEALVIEINKLMQREGEDWLPTGALAVAPGSFGDGIDYLQPMICWGKNREK